MSFLLHTHSHYLDWSGTNPDKSRLTKLVRSSRGFPLRLTKRSWPSDLTGRTILSDALRFWLNKIVMLQLGINQTSKGLVVVLLSLGLHILMMSLRGESLVFQDQGALNDREILLSIAIYKFLVLWLPI